ncbi:MAG: carboxymuconolactone decarboxylase family protein [Planctomycetaceae bacterium]
MQHLTPIVVSDAPEKVAQVFQRLAELFETEEIPAPFYVYGNVEPFLRDFYMNFKKFVYQAGQLDEKTKAAIALAVASQSKCKAWLDWSASRCQHVGFSIDQVSEILAVVATNAMYNTFFKFRELSGSSIFDGMGVGLRAHTFSNVSLDESLVELINIVISDINACRPCTSGHVEKAKQLGISNEQMLEAIQCGSTMYAGCQFLSATPTS